MIKRKIIKEKLVAGGQREIQREVHSTGGSTSRQEGRYELADSLER